MVMNWRGQDASPHPAADPYAAAREQMIAEQLRPRGIVMHRVIEAMREVPRHLFVEHACSSRAYADEALPSKAGQTISQPYMVAVMTQELDVREGQQVLELGTGTGYQTAILARLVGKMGMVYSIERMEMLADFAKGRLDAMGVKNVRYFVGDGSAGWPGPMWSETGGAMFDRIMVTAGTPRVPEPLVRQLAIGGIMVVPVGGTDFQTLKRVVKRENGALELTDVLDCRFVPLVGAFGWPGTE